VYLYTFAASSSLARLVEARPVGHGTFYPQAAAAAAAAVGADDGLMQGTVWHKLAFRHRCL